MLQKITTAQQLIKESPIHAGHVWLLFGMIHYWRFSTPVKGGEHWPVRNRALHVEVMGVKKRSNLPENCKLRVYSLRIEQQLFPTSSSTDFDIWHQLKGGQICRNCRIYGVRYFNLKPTKLAAASLFSGGCFCQRVCDLVRWVCCCQNRVYVACMRVLYWI